MVIMQIKGDLFRFLNMELSRNEVKTKLDEAALNQKENLNVDINQKPFLKDPKEDQKKKKMMNKKNKDKKGLYLVEDHEPLPEISKEDQAKAQAKAMLKKLNWL